MPKNGPKGGTAGGWCLHWRLSGCPGCLDYGPLELKEWHRQWLWNTLSYIDSCYEWLMLGMLIYHHLACYVSKPELRCGWSKLYLKKKKNAEVLKPTSNCSQETCHLWPDWMWAVAGCWTLGPQNVGMGPQWSTRNVATKSMNIPTSILFVSSGTGNGCYIYIWHDQPTVWVLTPSLVGESVVKHIIGRVDFWMVDDIGWRANHYKHLQTQLLRGFTMLHTWYTCLFQV